MQGEAPTGHQLYTQGLPHPQSTYASTRDSRRRSITSRSRRRRTASPPPTRSSIRPAPRGRAPAWPAHTCEYAHVTCTCTRTCTRTCCAQIYAHATHVYIHACLLAQHVDERLDALTKVALVQKARRVLALGRRRRRHRPAARPRGPRRRQRQPVLGLEARVRHRVAHYPPAVGRGRLVGRRERCGQRRHALALARECKLGVVANLLKGTVAVLVHAEEEERVVAARPWYGHVAPDAATHHGRAEVAQRRRHALDGGGKPAQG